MYRKLQNHCKNSAIFYAVYELCHIHVHATSQCATDVNYAISIPLSTSYIGPICMVFTQNARLYQEMQKRKIL